MHPELTTTSLILDQFNFKWIGKFCWFGMLIIPIIITNYSEYWGTVVACELLLFVFGYLLNRYAYNLVFIDGGKMCWISGWMAPKNEPMAVKISDIDCIHTKKVIKKADRKVKGSETSESWEYYVILKNGNSLRLPFWEKTFSEKLIRDYINDMKFTFEEIVINNAV